MANERVNMDFNDYLLSFSQFMLPMCKVALIAYVTVFSLHKVLAQLRLEKVIHGDSRGPWWSCLSHGITHWR